MISTLSLHLTFLVSGKPRIMLMFFVTHGHRFDEINDTTMSNHLNLHIVKYFDIQILELKLEQFFLYINFSNLAAS